MQALLEQSFDELYVIAKDRIEKCVKAMEQMTTFRFFVIWNTINEILFDVFHDTRFMWVISGCETDSKLTVCFHDKLMNLPTKKIDISILNEFKFISLEEFTRMSYDEIYKYVTYCRSLGYSAKDLSKHFGKGRSYVTCYMTQRKSGCKSRMDQYGVDTIIQRETVKLVISENIPLLTEVWKMSFPNLSQHSVTMAVYGIRSGRWTGKRRFISKDIKKAAKCKFNEYLKNLQPIVDDIIEHDSASRVYDKHYAIALGHVMHLKIKTRMKNCKFVNHYEGEHMSKLKQLQEKLQTLITLNKEGGKKK